MFEIAYVSLHQFCLFLQTTLVEEGPKINILELPNLRKYTLKTFFKRVNLTIPLSTHSDFHFLNPA